ncbi:MAG: DbpA RNA binding domain-containing protein, partial [Thioalkalivibrio sp.]|nr:DbpA RNA binding domain-containing protein [Thioalkalivibrio sp.]
AALNGDMEQGERERVVKDLRDGGLDVIVATDVAARGIDVPRISHVFNLDAPTDAEVYVHRIGRTGRAGRKGRAILFLEPRKRRILKDIERLTGTPVREQPVPGRQAVQARRETRFAERVRALIGSEQAAAETERVDRLLAESQASERDLATALLALATAGTPLDAPAGGGTDPLQAAADAPRSKAGRQRRDPAARSEHPARDRDREPETDRVRYYIPIGRNHGVAAGAIVGALANEGGLDGRDIGRIGLRDDHSHVDLPASLDTAAIHRLGTIHVANRKLELTRSPTFASEQDKSHTPSRRSGDQARDTSRPTGNRREPKRTGDKRPAYAGPSPQSARKAANKKSPASGKAGTLAIRRKAV